ncbi:MAG TPA: hypothetical protein VMD59_18500 [Acidimicrobiales bacterium]|nr:hypothetical protein [Acidimicrobiales bacterium]
MPDQQSAAERRFGALSEEQCLEYLCSARLGHLATTSRAMPVVVPVRLEVVGAEVMLEPLIEEVGKIAGDVVVALGVGNVGAGDGAEWMVHAIGVLAAIAAAPHGQPSRTPSAACDGRPFSFALRPRALTGWRREAARSQLEAC